MSAYDFVRAKNFLITYPHCDVKNEAILNELVVKDILVKHGIKYMICSKEFHQDGEEHHHVFVSLEAPLRLKREDMDKLDLKYQGDRSFHPNIKSCKSPKDAINYVKKDGEYITYGKCPYNIPLSTKEKNELLLSKSLYSLVADGDVSIFKIPQLEKAKKILENELGDVERVPPKVHWYYGSTGTGKTRTAIEEAKKDEQGYWISHETGEWFDGYNGQGSVILDDIRAATWPMQKLLRLCDRYKIQVPIKGGFVWWRPREIWITAPGRPEDIYKNYTTGQPYDCIEQLNRRISEFIDFDAETEPIDQVLYWKD